MSVKDMTVNQVISGVTLPTAAAALYFIHSYFIGLILAGDINNSIYHLEREILDLDGVKALYEARLEDNGALDAVDGNRYTIILGKIELARDEIGNLEDRLGNLR